MCGKHFQSSPRTLFQLLYWGIGVTAYANSEYDKVNTCDRYLMGLGEICEQYSNFTQLLADILTL